MRFAAALAFAMVPALCAATHYIKYDYFENGKILEPANPNDPNYGNHPGDKNDGKGKGNNECTSSSFIGLVQNDTAQPQVKDCQDMLVLLEKDESWEIDCTGVQIVTYKTCAFNAMVAPDYCEWCALLGNGDAHDVIEDSIAKYGNKSGTIPSLQGSFGVYVNGAGEMLCDSPALPQGHQVQVDWTLTHS